MAKLYGNIEDSDVPASLAPAIGQAVRSARDTIGYSIDQLAVTLGLTAMEITEVEAGATESFQVIARIARGLGISPNKLLPPSSEPNVA